MRRLFLLALLPALLAGCFSASHTRGAPLAYGAECDQVLKVGLVSRSDVLHLFGSPTDILSTHTGDVFRYVHEKSIRDGVDVTLSALWGALSLCFLRTEDNESTSENLTLFFDDRGILADWSYSPGLAAHDA